MMTNMEEDRIIGGLQLVEKRVRISQLQFANDPVFFSKYYSWESH